MRHTSVCAWFRDPELENRDKDDKDEKISK